MGGDAIASILFGDVSPSGRLPYTAYPSSFVNSRSIIDYNMTSGDGVTHLYYTGIPIFAWGTGLSYSTFALAWEAGTASHASVNASAWAAGEVASPSFNVRVTNTGGMHAATSVLGFWDGEGGVGAPRRELLVFARTPELLPGATATLTLTLSVDVAATVAPNGDAILTPGSYRVRVGDNDAYVKAVVELRGEAVVVFDMAGAMRSAL